MKKLLIVQMVAISAIIGCKTSNPVSRALPPDEGQVTTVLQIKTLKVDVKSAKGTRREFAEALGRKLVDECELRGFERADGSPDMMITVEATRKDLGRLGKFCAFGGLANVQVKIRGGQTLMKMFETERKEHGVGEDRAERPVVNELSEKIADWLERQLPGSQKPQQGDAEVQIQAE
ncbi:MAG: hypothetical protein J6Z49_12185 [Kiritimatiellae bacterium]|nr:hypothetical protein [Kiritimatiellia bacterium]